MSIDPCILHFLLVAELLLRKLEELNFELTCVRQENLQLLRRQAVSSVYISFESWPLSLYIPLLQCMIVSDQNEHQSVIMSRYCFHLLLFYSLYIRASHRDGFRKNKDFVVQYYVVTISAYGEHIKILPQCTCRIIRFHQCLVTNNARREWGYELHWQNKDLRCCVIAQLWLVVEHLWRECLRAKQNILLSPDNLSRDQEWLSS